MSSLGQLLPGFVAGMDGIAQLLDAISTETDALEAAGRANSRQLAAATAGIGLARWERELGIQPRPDLDTQSRRALVLAALSFFGPRTPQDLTALFARMTGGTAVYSETPGAYTIALEGETPGRVLPDLPGVARAVGRVAPAHVFCRLSVAGDMASEPVCRHALYGAVELTLHSQ